MAARLGDVGRGIRGGVNNLGSGLKGGVQNLGRGIKDVGGRLNVPPSERDLSLDQGFSQRTKAPLVVLGFGNASFLVRAIVR